MIKLTRGSKSALLRFHQWYAERISELVENNENFFRAAIVAMAEWLEKYKQAGCFFLRAIADYRNLEPPIAALGKQQKNRIRKILDGSAKQQGVQLTPAEFERLYFILEGLIASSQTLKLEAALKTALSFYPTLRPKMPLPFLNFDQPEKTCLDVFTPRLGVQKNQGVYQ